MMDPVWYDECSHVTTVHSIIGINSGWPVSNYDIRSYVSLSLNMCPGSIT